MSFRVANSVNMKPSFFPASLLVVVSILSTISAEGIYGFPPTDPNDPNVVYSGHYRIVNCKPSLPNSYASELQGLLPQIWTSLQKVLADVKLGTSSPHGFAALFKSNSNRQTVQSVFQSIADGGPVRGIVNPTLLCINTDDTDKRYKWMYEKNCAPLTPDGPPANAFAYPKLQVVGICPAFWELGALLFEKPNPHDCPSVSRENGVLASPIPLDLNQHSALIHELVHLYFAAGNHATEVYDLQQCVNLKSAESLANIPNWSYYAAGESRLTFLHICPLSEILTWYYSGPGGLHSVAPCPDNHGQ